ncbi:MAG: type II toxin-antitoxin system RelE/ParE family toxin [Oscillospiraceae bacterium]|jgi:mRNA interferase RelE/StbE|nr:type II toxin-antitoxin system RelE/ParE family toxin [Oscillospiraceae bacterium]
MSWSLIYTDEAFSELNDLDKCVKAQVIKGIRKALINPLPQSEGGYGHALGNKNGINLTGYLKLKFLKLGIRAVYKLERTEQKMRVIIISARSDNEVYIQAKKRIEKYLF